MRVLFLHNKYLIPGGEDLSTQSEIDLLSANGHEADSIIVSNEDIKDVSNVQLVKNTIWSRASYNLVDKALKAKKYDLVHVQNFFPLLSPSVFDAAKDNGVKVVMSVRNYRLSCPNALQFVNNEICTRCVGRTIPWPSLKYSCYKDDIKATSVVVAMLAFHNIKKTWLKKVDGYIAISNYVKSQLLLTGVPEEKIYVKYNFVNEPPSDLVQKDDFFLYVGRLSVEKGLDVLIDAFGSKELKGVKLKIIGDGPLKLKIVEAARENSDIEYLGKLPYAQTYVYMQKANALIFPSKWNEPFGRTIVESFAAGTPVIGAAVGGVTELIKPGINGLLFKGNDAKDLSSKVLDFIRSEFKGLMNESAHQAFLESFTAETNLRNVLSIYKEVLDQH